MGLNCRAGYATDPRAQYKHAGLQAHEIQRKTSMHEEFWKMISIVLALYGKPVNSSMNITLCSKYF